MTEGNNIVSMAAFKQHKQLNSIISDFKTYLQALESSQLGFEANHLLSKLDESLAPGEALMQMAILMEELASRVNNKKIAHSIQTFANNIYDELKQIDLALNKDFH